MLDQIRLFHKDKFQLNNPLAIQIVELYKNLSIAELNELAEYAIDSLHNDESTGSIEILTHIACLSEHGLTSMHAKLIEKNIFYPGIIYRKASIEISNEIIKIISKAQSSPSITHLLSALAWTGNTVAISAFREWQSNPPNWVNNLSVTLEYYPKEAGWELTENGRQRWLFSNLCFPFIKRMNNLDRVENSTKVILDNESLCKWCGQRLTTLFDINLALPTAEFLHLSGTRLKITTCSGCNCYGPIYTEINFDGQSAWSPINHLPSYLPDDTDWAELPKDTLILSEQSRFTYTTASQFVFTTFSQLGGFPTWVQYTDYPLCQRCLKTMQFIAQLDVADIEEYGEGLYYAFLCTDCRIACTIYQQS